MKIVFLDRDGVINKELGRHVCTPDEFEILPDVIDSLDLLKNKGFQFIIITNQSGIARGLYSHDQLKVIHNKLDEVLISSGLKVLDYYYCPHLPEHSRCLCRKPGSLLLEKAISKYRVNVAESYLIGDRERDISAAEAVGLKAFLINSNTGIYELCKRLSGE